MNIKEAEEILIKEKFLAKEMKDFYKIQIDDEDPEAVEHRKAKIIEFAKRVRDANTALRMVGKY